LNFEILSKLYSRERSDENSVMHLFNVELNRSPSGHGLSRNPYTAVKRRVTRAQTGIQLSGRNWKTICLFSLSQLSHNLKHFWLGSSKYEGLDLVAFWMSHLFGLHIDLVSSAFMTNASPGLQGPFNWKIYA